MKQTSQEAIGLVLRTLVTRTYDYDCSKLQKMAKVEKSMAYSLLIPSLSNLSALVWSLLLTDNPNHV